MTEFLHVSGQKCFVQNSLGVETVMGEGPAGEGSNEVLIPAVCTEAGKAFRLPGLGAKGDSWCGDGFWPSSLPSNSGPGDGSFSPIAATCFAQQEDDPEHGEEAQGHHSCGSRWRELFASGQSVLGELGTYWASLHLGLHDKAMKKLSRSLTQVGSGAQ